MTRGKGAVTEVKRKLAAILSAELVGYSRLMGDDERATMDTLHTYRDACRRHIGAHDGRVVDNLSEPPLRSGHNGAKICNAGLCGHGRACCPHNTGPLGTDERWRACPG